MASRQHGFNDFPSGVIKGLLLYCALYGKYKCLVNWGYVAGHMRGDLFKLQHCGGKGSSWAFWNERGIPPDFLFHVVTIYFYFLEERNSLRLSHESRAFRRGMGILTLNMWLNGCGWAEKRNCYFFYKRQMSGLNCQNGYVCTWCCKVVPTEPTYEMHACLYHIYQVFRWSNFLDSKLVKAPVRTCGFI